MASARAVTTRILEIVTVYVNGYTTFEVAAKLGISHETVRSAISATRTHLRHLGYTGIHTTIGLRRALRQNGDIPQLDEI